ncbi:MAG: hypothetical protein ACFE9R_05805 [Candidatus Hermodarchaeota archaeon]
MNILTFFIILVLYSYGFLALYITYQARKKGEQEAFINNLANSLVLIISITVNIIFLNVLNISNLYFLIFPFDILTVLFIVIFLPLFFLSLYREKKKIQIKDSSWQKYYIPTVKQLPLKYEIYRKLTHLLVLGIVFFYFTLGFFVQNFFVYVLDSLPEFMSDLFYSFYNIESDKMVFTQYLVVFLVGISLIGMLTADSIRILKPELYPLKPVNLILRPKELKMRLGPHISMGIGCFSIIILFGIFQPIGPLIICVSMSMAIFSDISSNLFGRKFGTKKIRSTNKTYEGLFAGMIVAFFSGYLSLVIINPIISINPLNFILIPFIGALIIGFFDYLDLEIDDNLIYNLCVTTILFFISISL